MRILVLLVILGSVLWYFFVGSRRMDEDQVRAAYAQYFDAFHEDDGKGLCDLFDKDFAATIKTKTPAGPIEEKATKSTSCENSTKFFAMKKTMEKKVGEELFFNIQYTIDEIELAPDKKSAKVLMHSEILLGTEQRRYMKITETQTDTLVRQVGKMKFTSTDALISFY